MNFELLNRVHKELSITGQTFYETVLAISEQVNRKVHIIRLHWQASTLLQRIDDLQSATGQQTAKHVGDRLHDAIFSDSAIHAFDVMINDTLSRVQELKQSLARVDTHIREVKLETVREDVVALQRDLANRSAGIERLIVSRTAAAVGQPFTALPRSLSVHVAAILRGPFLLAPDEHFVFRSGDIVLVLGLHSELDQLTPWLTGQRPLSTPLSRSM